MQSLNVTVIIATAGRPQEVAQLLEQLNNQVKKPDRVIISVSEKEDLPIYDGCLEFEAIQGPKGLCAQRNSALEMVGENTDIVFFMDDDYLPSRFSIENVQNFFLRVCDVVGVSGKLLADGINVSGISLQDSLRLINRNDQSKEELGVRPDFRESSGLYGCNMAFRWSAISGRRFDENLPKYGWQEDIDFSARVSSSGKIGYTNSFCGVHRGVKRGRVSGVQFGYSQVANIVYLVRKGTMRPMYGLKLSMKNIISNHIKALKPEPWVDRVGRVKGNWIALRHLFSGRINPLYIVELS